MPRTVTFEKEGRVITLEVPDGATKEQLRQKLSEVSRRLPNTAPATLPTPQGVPARSQIDPTRAYAQERAYLRIAPDRTRGQALQKVNHYLDNLSRQAVQGLTFGFGDEIGGRIDEARGIASYETAVANRRAQTDHFEKTNPVAAFGAQLGGGLLPVIFGGGPAPVVQALAKGGVAARSAKLAGLGAVTGGASGLGAGEGSFAERLPSATANALIGGAFGGALVPAGAALRYGGNKVVNALARAVPPLRGHVADRTVVEALARDNLTPTQASEKLRTMGGPTILADVGDNVRRLAGAITRKSGQGGTNLKNTIVNRQRGTTDNDLWNPVTLGQKGRLEQTLTEIQPHRGRPTLDALAKQKRTEAAPLYREAFSGGSIAPLENQIADQLTDVGGQLQAAQKAVQDINRSGLLDAANASQNRLSPDGETARAALAEAQERVQRLTDAQEVIRRRLMQARADGSAKAPGAVWSPRLQEFLDSRWARKGLARGLEIQEADALAARVPFNPSEYAITGYKSNGEPIVAAVPNMRLLDAVKRGLDSMVNAARHPDKTLKEEGLILAKVRDAYVSELKDLTGGESGAYARALASWSDKTTQEAANRRGQQFLNHGSFPSVDDLDATLAALSPVEQDYFRLGAIQALRDKLEPAGLGANATNFIEANRERIKRAFGDKQTLRHYIAALKRESQMYGTFGEVDRGSQTATRLAATETLDEGPSTFRNAARNAAAPLTEAARNPDSGIAWTRALASLFPRFKTAPNEPIRNEIAQILAARTPEEVARLNKAFQRQQGSKSFQQAFAPLLTYGVSQQEY